MPIRALAVVQPCQKLVLPSNAMLLILAASDSYVPENSSCSFCSAPEMTAAVSPGETLAVQPDEPYVTLIVQVMVPEPEPRRPARAARPAKSEAKPQNKKSRKSRVAE